MLYFAGRKGLALPSCKAHASLFSCVARYGKSTLHYWTRSYGAFQRGLTQTTGETRRGFVPGCPGYEQKQVESGCIVLHGSTHRVLAHVFKDIGMYQNPLCCVCGKPLTLQWNYSIRLKSFLCQSVDSFPLCLHYFSPTWSQIARVCAE